MTVLKNCFMETVRLSQQASEFLVRELPYLESRVTGELLNGPHQLDVLKISSARVHHWIGARAKAQPQAIALYSAERKEEMTYLQLDNTSNQFAHCKISPW